MSTFESSLDSLVIIEPEALLYIMDKSAVVVIRKANGTGKLEVSLDENPPEGGKASFIRKDQDGICIFLAEDARPGQTQQLEIGLKKGWLGRKVIASYNQKQTVPGFMGTRG